MDMKVYKEPRSTPTLRLIQHGDDQAMLVVVGSNGVTLQGGEVAIISNKGMVLVDGMDRDLGIALAEGDGDQIKLLNDAGDL